MAEVDRKELAVVLARGVNAEQKLALIQALRHMSEVSGRVDADIGADKIGRPGAMELRQLSSASAIEWPERARVESVARGLGAIGSRLLWRGDETYRKALQSAVNIRGEEGFLTSVAPAWLFIAGESRRLERPRVAVIGSRRLDAVLSRAANRLGRVLAEVGVTVVSGLAPGADSAAHAGAVQAQSEAGTVAVPAAGILKAAGLGPLIATGRATALGLGLPDSAFRPEQAIARNRLVADLSEAVVLVASDLRGGSAHAVRRALETGKPVLAFDAGRRTPAGNAALIRAGQATALELGAGPEAWVEAIQAATAEAEQTRLNGKTRSRYNTQLSLPI